MIKMKENCIEHMGYFKEAAGSDSGNSTQASRQVWLSSQSHNLGHGSLWCTNQPDGGGKNEMSSTSRKDGSHHYLTCIPFIVGRHTNI